MTVSVDTAVDVAAAVAAEVVVDSAVDWADAVVEAPADVEISVEVADGAVDNVELSVAVDESRSVVDDCSPEQSGSLSHGGIYSVHVMILGKECILWIYKFKDSSHIFAYCSNIGIYFNSSLDKYKSFLPKQYPKE